MRMTSRKKEILSFFEPDHREWVTGEIGSPLFDVSGVAYLLSGMDSFKSRHPLESARRTLEAMVNDGLLEKIISYEQRQDSTQSGAGKGVWCNCSRYGLIGQCLVMRDRDGSDNYIEGEFDRVN